jgi:hypothetical protein
MISTQFGISNLATALLGTTRARGFSRSGFVWSLIGRFQSRAVEASRISIAADGIRVGSFKVGPRRAWLSRRTLRGFRVRQRQRQDQTHYLARQAPDRAALLGIGWLRSPTNQ